MPSATFSTPVYFEVVGVEKTVSNLSGSEKELARLISNCVNESLFNISRNAQKRAPVNMGDLRAGIHPTPATPDYPSGEVGAYEKHAAWMEFGTGPMGASTNRQPLPPWYRHGATHRLPVIASAVGFGGKASFQVVPGLARWAVQHGRSPMAIAMGIAGRVFRGKGFAMSRLPGLRARPYFYPSAREEMPLFERRLVERMRLFRPENRS